MKKILRQLPLYKNGKTFFYFFRNLFDKIAGSINPGAYILLYHRVARVEQDPHRLCVSPDNFRDQIRFLKEHYEIIPLVKLVQNIRAGKVERNTIVITFDDGYADNLHNALPILKELQVPAIMFLTADYLNQGKTFYWDQSVPETSQGQPLTANEAKTLSQNRFIEIGAHTLTHPNLASLSELEQSKEIVGSKQKIEKLLDIPILSFAYPFGGKDSFTKETVRLVKQAGFRYACTNIHKRATKNSDIYALPRFIVRNWGLTEFQQKLKKFV